MRLLEYERAFLVLLPPHNAPGNRSKQTLHGWPEITTSLVFKKRMGKVNFYKPFKHFIFHYQLFGTFTLNNVNAGGPFFFLQEPQKVRLSLT